jgi:integrase
LTNSKQPDLTVAAFIKQYEHHLVEVRGLARNSCRLHMRVVRTLFEACVTSGKVIWNDLRFEQIAAFLTSEFRRLPNHFTQRAWLTIVRGLVRYLEAEGYIPHGWLEALPKRVNWKQASLPRYLSVEQIQALWDACGTQTHRHVRDRALLLVFTKLGLRTEEVAALTVKDVDWKCGSVLIRSTKTRRERTLPLSDDVGQGLIAHLRVRPQKSLEIFAARCAPFTPERNHHHVRNAMASLFRRAGIPHSRLHSLRHTAATAMVNRGAKFKEIADVLGHKSVATTMIYAKLDVHRLAKVALPWPGVSR